MSTADLGKTPASATEALRASSLSAADGVLGRPPTTGRGSAAHVKTRSEALASEPARQAFVVLRTAFTVAPILFGLDKFFGILVDWDKYLSPFVRGLSPLSVHQTFYVIGVIEIVAGVLVAVHPRLGAIVVALWLAGIIVNLLLVPGFVDVALRDVGLLLGAVALQRLSAAFAPRHWPFRT